MEIKGKARALFPPPRLGCSSYGALCSTLICSGSRAAADASSPSTVHVQFPGCWWRAGGGSCFPPQQLWPARLGAGQPLSPSVCGTMKRIRLIRSHDDGILPKVVTQPKIHVLNEEVAFSCRGYLNFTRPLQKDYSSTATFSFTPDTTFKFRSRSEQHWCLSEKYFKSKFSVRKVNPAKDVRAQDEKYSAFKIYHHMSPEDI